MKKSMLAPAVLCCIAVLAPLVTGCNANSPEIPKDEFTKPHPMPADAQKKMQERMNSRSTPQPNGK
jgi:hypothetical protein